jgi:hypothetical protein
MKKILLFTEENARPSVGKTSPDESGQRVEIGEVFMSDHPDTQAFCKANRQPTYLHRQG